MPNESAMPADHLSREDWIIEALATLDREGIHEVKVERLALQLGVTKGSFYWHFENRQDLLEGILEYWSADLTKATLEKLGRIPNDPRCRLLWLLESFASEDLNRHDSAIRTWAMIDPTAREVLHSVDSERLGYIRKLFCDMGFEDREAELRSRMSYYYVIGEQTAAIDQTLHARLANVATRHRLLTNIHDQGCS